VVLVLVQALVLVLEGQPLLWVPVAPSQLHTLVRDWR